MQHSSAAAHRVIGVQTSALSSCPCLTGGRCNLSSSATSEETLQISGRSEFAFSEPSALDELFAMYVGLWSRRRALPCGGHAPETGLDASPCGLGVKLGSDS